MKKNTFKLLLLSMICLTTTTACSSQKKNTSTDTAKDISLQSSAKTEHENIRLNFNSVQVGHAANEFKGGTNLEQLKTLFGQPTSYEQVPAGDVTLDSYTWKIDQITLVMQLFQDSTISRSISYFTFSRTAKITKKQYDKLTDGITYNQAVDILGQPDNLSETASSDKEEIQALWNSGIKSSSVNPQIYLIFTNNALTKKTQNGLK